MLAVRHACRVTVSLYACLLGVDAIHTMCQAELLEHEVAARLKQFANDAVWLLEVSLNEQYAPTSLQKSTKHLQGIVWMTLSNWKLLVICNVTGAFTCPCENASADPAMPAPTTTRSHTCLHTRCCSILLPFQQVLAKWDIRCAHQACAYRRVILKPS